MLQCGWGLEILILNKLRRSGAAALEIGILVFRSLELCVGDKGSVCPPTQFWHRQAARMRKLGNCIRFTQLFVSWVNQMLSVSRIG